MIARVLPSLVKIVRYRFCRTDHLRNLPRHKHHGHEDPHDEPRSLFRHHTPLLRCGRPLLAPYWSVAVAAALVLTALSQVTRVKRDRGESRSRRGRWNLG